MIRTTLLLVTIALAILLPVPGAHASRDEIRFLELPSDIRNEVPPDLFDVPGESIDYVERECGRFLPRSCPV